MKRSTRVKTKKILSLLLAIAIVVSESMIQNFFVKNEVRAEEMIRLSDSDVEDIEKDISVNRVSVHDPSVVKDGDTYYIFGSHKAFAKSTDLINWEMFDLYDSETTRNATICETIFATNSLWSARGTSEEYSISGNLWAPAVIYNDTMNKWCMYMSINGSNNYSSIALATADDIEGPYEYVGTIVYSGFNYADEAAATDYCTATGDITYENIQKYQYCWWTYGVNAIDPCVIYDENGDLWMSYGSWFGGIYMLKLDKSTGLRDYSYTYTDSTDESGAVLSDAYLGVHISGGYGCTGEGSYIVYDEVAGYYYLYMSYGGLESTTDFSNYHMRLFRSESITGPYVDSYGNNAICESDIVDQTMRGVKLMGNYFFTALKTSGEEAVNGYMSPGHNSAFIDDDGNRYLIYHTRFNNGTEGHQVRVHQQFLNEDGWLVTAPYEYLGSEISNDYSDEEIVGTYEFVDHYSDTAGAYHAPMLGTYEVTLNADGTITGNVTGTWARTDNSYYCTMDINGEIYKGVFFKQYDESQAHIEVMTFSLIGENDRAIMGSKIPSDEEIVVENKYYPMVLIPNGTSTSLNYDYNSVFGAGISYSSSNEDVISDSGVVTRPLEDTNVTITRTISKGNYCYDDEIDVIVYGKDSGEDVLFSSYDSISNYQKFMGVKEISSETGVSITFTISGITSDWTPVLKTDNDEIVYLSVLNYEGINIFEAVGTLSEAAVSAGYDSGSAWTIFTDGATHEVCISYNLDGSIGFYRDGILMLTYEADTSIGGYSVSDLSNAMMLAFRDGAVTCTYPMSDVSIDYAKDYIPSNENLAFSGYSKLGDTITVENAPEDAAYIWELTDMTNGSITYLYEDSLDTTNYNEHMIKCTISSVSDGTVTKLYMYCSSLPVLYIDSDTSYGLIGKEDYSDATMKLVGNEEFQDEELLYDGAAEIKLRGNSTAYRAKRPFRVKLDKKADLLGLGSGVKSKHWVLLANDIDHTLIRNKLLYDFSGTIGTEFYFESTNISVIFNGEYIGVYQLCEHRRVDEGRIDITDWVAIGEDAAEIIAEAEWENAGYEKAGKMEDALNELMYQDYSWMDEGKVTLNGVTYSFEDYGVELPEANGGFLAEMDFYSIGDSSLATLTTAYGQPLYFSHPEAGSDAGDIYTAVASFKQTKLFDYAYKYTQSFEYALHSKNFVFDSGTHQTILDNGEFNSGTVGGWNSTTSAITYDDSANDGKHYSELFDMDSLVTNFIFVEYAMNWDSMKNSFFFYKDIDELAKIGPQWDFDWSLGNINMYNINTWWPESWQTTNEMYTREQAYQSYNWNRLLIKDPYFLVRAYEKYNEVRADIEEMVKDGGIIDQQVESLTKAGLANDYRWSYTYDTDYSGTIAENFTDSIASLKSFLGTRLVWMDEQFSSLDSLVNSLGYYKEAQDIDVSCMIDGELCKVMAVTTNEACEYVAFQLNGTVMSIQPVQNGIAEVTFIDSEVQNIIADGETMNVIVVYEMDSAYNYILNENLKPSDNYESIAKSAYTVFIKDAEGLTDNQVMNGDYTEEGKKLQSEGEFSEKISLTGDGTISVEVEVVSNRKSLENYLWAELVDENGRYLTTVSNGDNWFWNANGNKVNSGTFELLEEGHTYRITMTRVANSITVSYYDVTDNQEVGIVEAEFNELSDTIRFYIIAQNCALQVVKADDMTTINAAQIIMEKDQYNYTGEAITPDMTVMLNGKELSSENYTTEYYWNRNLGFAIVIIRGVEENGYRGSAMKIFQINTTPIEINAELNGNTVYGETLTLDASNEKDQRMLIRWYSCDEVITSETDFSKLTLIASDVLEYEIKESDIGKYIGVMVTTSINDNPYVGTVYVCTDSVIDKAVNSNIPDISAINEQTYEGNDGKIVGLELTMEYSSDGGNTYTSVTNVDADFAPGTYHVRYAETSTHKASESVEVTINKCIIPTDIVCTETIILNKTGQASISVTVSPDNITEEYSVEFVSEDTSIATVDATGKVTGVAVGTVNINVNIIYNGAILISDICTVTVNSPMSGIEVEETSVELYKGNISEIEVNVLPFDVTDVPEITYLSSNTSVATVDANGKITAVGKGTATITVTATAGTNVKTATVSVTVKLLAETISVDETKNILTGCNSTLSVVVGPEGCEENYEISYSSSNEEIATVDTNGKVTGVKEGVATITVTLKVNGKVVDTATCEVTIQDEEVPMTGIEVEPSSVTLYKGETSTIKVSLLPLDTTDSPSYSYSSSNNSVATVDANGKITAVGKGTATITVTAKVGTNVKTATVSVNVKLLAETISVDETMDIYTGYNSTLVTVVGPEGCEDNYEVSYSSSNEEIATVDTNGKVTGVKEGVATITVTLKVNGKVVDTAICEVTIQDEEIPMTGIEVESASVTLYKGETSTIKVSILPVDTTDSPSYSYSSSNEEIATVDANGKITAVGAGTATITVTATAGTNIKTATVSVTVKVNANTVIVDETLQLQKGENDKLTVKVLPEDTTETYTIEYSSNKEEVATVDANGKITAVSVGTATITVSLKIGTEIVDTATCEVTVYVPQSGVTAQIDKEVIYIGGDNAVIKATVVPEDTTDNVEIKYSSSDEKIATVDEDGIVTAISVGKVIITVTAGEFSDTIEIEVKEPVIESEIDKAEDVPAMNVVIDETDIEEMLQLTDEEKEAVYNGAEATLKLEINNIDETVTKEDKNLIGTAIEKVLKDTFEMVDVVYLDVDAYKIIGTAKTQLTGLGKEIEIVITVPTEWIPKDDVNREFMVLRIHDGIAEKLESTYDAKEKTVTVKTDKFSTYALVYADEVPKTQDTPYTADVSNYTLLLSLLVASMIIFLVYNKKKVEDR